MTPEAMADVQMVSRQTLLRLLPDLRRCTPSSFSLEQSHNESAVQ